MSTSILDRKVASLKYQNTENIFGTDGFRLTLFDVPFFTKWWNEKVKVKIILTLTIWEPSRVNVL